MTSCVSDWFGPRFDALHPQLQQLHLHGGQLDGTVTMRFGSGLAGLIGKRLARKLGAPTQAGEHAFHVDIRHGDRKLHWDRRFDNAHWMHSTFEPVGRYPEGCWLEQTGPLKLRLTVDVIDGGWHWRKLGVRVGGIPLPNWLFPHSTAWKRIEDGQYRFYVAFSLPVFGLLLAYGGQLQPALATDSSQPRQP
ncbi:protein of unknown function [Andreprevotia lacus DSM 23236]|jgi:hypothetical protein|uniref:DUF4166 domain-containing protein n=1 Tax=Andreprevotia lacus DSM 23236 TaxID=1121001 RepID=A0A1W1Y0W4_9NEIS|nr:DUF4166 domain-containing protein [Andreprevotia lacus]SMC29782.1 protein of unknown function [Andreprevotia lacus DSM 23236]